MNSTMTDSLRTRVKICGLTRAEDVRAACALGADAVGFVCHPASPRFVEPARLAALAQAIAPLVTPVLLFVDAPRAVVEAALAGVPQAWLQFHGDESPDECNAFGRPYLRAVALGAGVDLLEFERRFARASALLADTPGASATASPTAAYGGSGRTFDWNRVPARAARGLPLFLAGGLNADNVAAAVTRVRPYAVDVSSGVESAPGVKDTERMRRFIAAVRRADEENGVA
jgi:phosphoribosylanthranilate isomerase